MLSSQPFRELGEACRWQGQHQQRLGGEKEYFRKARRLLLE